ncbi:MAG TPA: hypothetical protein VGC57_15425 [Cellulomonas sp.]
MTGYTVNPRILAKDATAFFASWSETLDGVRETIPTGLVGTDFSFIAGGAEMFADYQRTTALLDAYVADGAGTFDGFARALLLTAQEYLHAETDSVATVERLQRELDAL